VASPDRQSQKIVVVDDASDLLFLLQTFLVDEGYDVVTCSKPDDAVSCIKRELPDLLILDVRMPLAQDWQVFDQVKNDPVTGQIPCIVYSAAVMQLREREAELRAAGCEVQNKPFDLDDLLAKVERLIGPAAQPA
jgi:CheY-like chemotaxis protein